MTGSKDATEPTLRIPLDVLEALLENVAPSSKPEAPPIDPNVARGSSAQLPSPASAKTALLVKI